LVGRLILYRVVLFYERYAI